MQALWRQHRTDPPPLLDGVPDPIAQVVLRALAKQPADRHPDAHTFASDLARAATSAYGPDWTTHTGLPLHLPDDIRRITSLAPDTPTRPTVQAPPPRPRPRPAGNTGPVPWWRRRRRRRLLAATGTAVLALAAALTILITTTTGGSPPAFVAAGPPLTGHTDAVGPVAFAPDGHTLATGSADSTVRLWDVTDPRQARPLGSPLTGHTGAVESVAFAPDGHTLATASYDKTVRLWKARVSGS
ncbi:WD40 repeat-containing protein [Candidatus Protofrankia datiscae]|uniref:WD40 repeat-containing protein n=3 Tax=Protofrankia TaxID=2994361 RepID=F8AZU5_9ACTN|nr:WD40 repeat-containing protein [Candidatus Protofrankia datiscae]AEH10584.1 WD40 repeat-containing protein [Candidatus Protofrankia datiscae]